MIVLVTEPPPAKKGGDYTISITDEDRKLLIQDLRDEILSEYLKSFGKLLLPKGPMGRLRDAQQLENKVERLRGRIRELETD